MIEERSLEPKNDKANDDMLFRVTKLSISKTAGTWRDNSFGIPEYRPPVRDHFRPRIRHFSTNKEKFRCFTDKHAGLYKINPGPSHKNYEIVWDWKKPSIWRDGAFDKHVGTFLKKPRVTFTAETIKDQKKQPAPNKYI